VSNSDDVHNSTRLRPDRKFEFSPASLDSSIKAFNLGVRYERNKKYSLEKTKNGVVIRLNDRTLYLMRSFQPSPERLFGHDYDEVISLDLLLNKDMLGNLGYNYMMVNAAEISSKYAYDDYDLEQTELWPHVLSDSGGFQLSTGALDFLDPEEIIEKHNRVCDIGIILDIPLPHKYQQFLLPRAARVQRANNQVLLKRKRKSLDLMNVIHGSSFYLRRKFRDVVEDDKITRVALGGVKTLDLVPLVMHTLMLTTEGKKYAHYHVLGVSGLERWVALSYLAHRLDVKLITSDSSSYIQSGINLQYYDPVRLLGIHDLRDGSNKLVRKAMTLPCSCTVCSLVRHALALSDRNNSMNFTLVVAHNLIVSRSYIDEIWLLTKQTKKEILQFLQPMFSPAKLHTLNKALSAIDMGLEEGADKAAAKYAPFLLEKFPRRERTGLFLSNDKPDTKQFKRFDKVIASYEKYHQLEEKK
jgi:tRNA-guanine family transglycosylase